MNKKPVKRKVPASGSAGASVSKLAAELSQLHAVLDNVGAFIYTKDADGRYTYANRKVRELFSCSLDEVAGRHDREFWDDETAKAIEDNDRKVLRSGKSIEIEEANLRNGTGESRIYLSQKSPLHDENDTVVGMCGISTDITERKRLERELEANRALLDTVLNNLDAFVYMKDPDLRFIYVNDKTAALFGKPASEIVGRTNHEVLPYDIAEHFSETDRKVFADGEKQVAEESSLGSDGIVHHYWSHKIPLSHEGRVYAYLGFSTDITELHEAREELHRLAMSDALTGLYNRRYFMDTAQREFRRARRYGEALSLISIDIDHFKWVNDEFGHHVGDLVLCQVSEELRSHARESDVLARIGGEEFLLLLPSTGLDAAAVLANRIRQLVAARPMEGPWKGVISSTISLGVTTLVAEDAELDSLIIRADRALYQAKEHGRNRVCVLSYDADHIRPKFIHDE